MYIQYCAALLKKMFCVNKLMLTNVENVLSMVTKSISKISMGQRGRVDWLWWVTGPIDWFKHEVNELVTVGDRLFALGRKS